MSAEPKLLVTRPRPDAERTAAHLRAIGIEPVIVPMLELKPLPAPRFDPARYAAIAITSANAVRALEEGGQARALSGLPVFAVGEQSANEARASGFSSVTGAAGTLTDLADIIKASAPDGEILYLAAHHQSGDLAGLLAQQDIETDTRVVYEMAPANALSSGTANGLIAGEIAGAVFYSRRTAEQFAHLCAPEKFAPVRPRLECLCLSHNCARPLLESHFLRISLADYPSNEAMMSLALAFAREQISP